MKPTPGKSLFFPCSLFPVSCLLFFFSLLLMARPSYGQFAATYGGGNRDDAYSIQQTSDGGYIVAGRTASFGAGEDDFWVLRLNTDGTIDPSCEFIDDTEISGSTTEATITTTEASVDEPDIDTDDTGVEGQDTNVSEDIICHVYVEPIPIPSLTPLGTMVMALLITLYGTRGLRKAGR